MSVDPKTHGMNVYRSMLEDENAHLEDAVRTGIAAAVQEERRQALARCETSVTGEHWWLRLLSGGRRCYLCGKREAPDA